MSFKSNIKKFIIAGLLFSILFNIQKEHLNFGSPHNIVCDMCYHAKKINSFPRKGQFNKSGNSSTSQGKFNFFQRSQRKVAYSCIFTEVQHVPLAEYCFKKLNDKQILGFLYITSSILHFTFTINPCNKWVERMAVVGVWAFILCTGHRWHKTKEEKPWNNSKQIFPEQKTKKSFVLRHLCPVHDVVWL